MAKKINVAICSQNGEATEKKVGLDAEVFGIEPNAQVMFDAIQVYQSNMRQATAKTKTRSEVRGGGKKPWRQKGTGRARAGSSRSPIWVGGGTVFGPVGTQNYKLSMNKKAHALAVKSALSEKASENKIIVLDAIAATKTKEVVAMLDALKLLGKTLIVVADDNGTIFTAARNVASVKVVTTNNVCVYDLVNVDQVIFTLDAVKAVEGGLK